LKSARLDGFVKVILRLGAFFAKNANALSFNDFLRVYQGLFCKQIPIKKL
jgi:hypothetical protein